MNKCINCKDSKYFILAIEILAVILIITGLIPREAAFFILGLLIFYIIFSPLEHGVLLFVSSIPLFIALPITKSFDSLSSARIIIAILFLKWLFAKKHIKLGKIEILSILLLLIMIISILPAVDKITAIKKIIYLINLGVLVILVKNVIKDSIILKKMIKAIMISAGIVTIFALIQLISVYSFNIGNFWNYWADNVAYNFYGGNLRDIVRNTNAWFASSPSGPSIIRLFGSFTDPHSFALYLLLSLPFIISISISKIKDKFRKEWIWLIICLFFIILSGTRGIWLGVVFGFIAIIYLLFRKMNLRQSISPLLVILVIFVFFIPIVSIFTTIPQFKESSSSQDNALILKRLTSILDLDEASNQGRIYIWKRSLESFKNYPLLGIGTGNFPVVLNQDIALAKAGSSAHNLYLNFLVENGIFGFILVLLIIIEILLTVLNILKLNIPNQKKLMIVSLFVFLVWTFGYSFFDIALLDERVFLLFLTILGIIYAIKKNPKILENE